MDTKDFQNGDCIKYQSDRVLKIVDADNMQAIDADGNTVSYSDGCPNIGLDDDEVMQICGFTKDGNIWKCKIGDTTIKYNDGVCKLRNPYKAPQEKDLCVLSALQDCVREYTGEELPINHQQLAEYIKDKQRCL